MRHIYKLLADMIEEGRVVVDIPAVDMDKLERICREHNGGVLAGVRAIVYDEGITAERKIQILGKFLRYAEKP